ncbi:MAG TPA: glycoside hydrolase family 16 protein [Nocardioidaceae bacterium]|nr:glycoside hydrolase family 16 protein [Nocardioidaceae bacterium]
MGARLGSRRIRFAVMLTAAALLSTLPGAGVPALLPGEPAAAAPSCGAAVAKADGSSWICTFADEFSLSRLDTTKWLPITTASNGYTNGGECFRNHSSNISVGGGSLRLTVRKESQPFLCKSPHGSYTTQYTGGYVATYGKFAQAYGRFEIRAKFPAVTTTGVHSALWLYPKSLLYGAWPASGEIDIAEFFTKYPDRAIPHLHYKKASVDANVTNNFCMISNPADWHTYTLEWLPGSLTISYDGQVCLSTTSWYPDGLLMPAPFNQPFFINLTQALGRGLNPFDPATTPLPATMYVDYVRAWR